MTEGQGTIGLQSLNDRVEALAAALAVVNSQNDHLTAWVEELIEERDDAKAALAKAAATLLDDTDEIASLSAALAKAVEALAVARQAIWSGDDTDKADALAAITKAMACDGC